jgi:flagellar hook-associated protein 3 FlgL
LLTPSSGTITVADVPGGLTAADLGIRSAAAASVIGGDLDPRLTLQTTLASFNGGAGVTATATGGLRIVNGDRTSIVDVSGATTVEDLFNLLRQADPDLDVGINAAGNGLRIATRRSGVDFSIGENGETTATDLGVRTFSGATSLASLNHGLGANVDGGDVLTIHRRDGTTTTTVSLAGAKTVQDVLNAINAATPAGLTATLNTVGNGIQLNDASGTGTLTIDAGELARQLGLGGSAAGPAEPLAGRDVAPTEVRGVTNILVRLADALERGDDVEIGRLSAQIDAETIRVNQARGEVGGRLKVLDSIHSRLEDETLNIQESLSVVFDTDSTEAITRMVNQQFVLESTLKTAAQTLQLSLLQYL